MEFSELLLVFTGDNVILPGFPQNVSVATRKKVKMIEKLLEEDKLIGSYFGLLPNEPTAKPAELVGKIGTLAKVNKFLKVKRPGTEPHFVLNIVGKSRFRVESIVSVTPHLTCTYTTFGEDRSTAVTDVVDQKDDDVVPLAVADDDNDDNADKLASQLRAALIKYLMVPPRSSRQQEERSSRLPAMIKKIPDHLLPDLVATIVFSTSKKDKLKILSILDKKDRFAFALELLTKELEKRLLVEIPGSFSVSLTNGDDVKKKLFGSRKLMPPLPPLPGMPRNEEEKKLEEKLTNLKLPEQSTKMVMSEMARMKKMPKYSQDYHNLRDYLETVAALPWNTSTEDKITLEQAEEILENDHYSMKDIKKRILEYLAVNKLEKDLQREEKDIKLRNPILCFVGYPGVGKTSVAKSIAHSLGRKFVRIALGGAHDQSVIRGHRRTYVGAMCGRIIDGLKVAGVNNPVILLDEIDKLKRSNHGDPSAALLEVLDPEQNNSFVDNYLNIPFDLSTCIFICTANNLSGIPHALADRMEIIRMSGYTVDEKFEIAKKFLLPKQMKAHGIKSWSARNKMEINISDEFVRMMISKYTMETGVRDVDRKIAALCRYLVLEVSKRKDEENIVISLDSEEDLREIFGAPKYLGQKKRPITKCGMATGLSVNAFGGQIMMVESSRVKVKSSSGKIQLTGQLGSVLQESAHIAITYLRSNAKRYGLSEDFEDYNYHIHMPAGGTRKDGPSAGITMATALFSLLSKKLVNSDVVMTGELSLRGRVLPIGGVKNKVMAAQRLGFTKVILPRDNKVDAEEDLPADLMETMEITYVEFIDEVFKVAIEGFVEPPPFIRSGL